MSVLVALRVERVGPLAVVLLLLFSIKGLAYNGPFVPPLLPLSPFPVVNGDQLQEYAQDVLQVLGEATLPTRPDEVIAIMISETIAGFAGGVSERMAAFLVGDAEGFEKNIKGSTASAYFGVRSAVSSVGGILGLPVPISRLIAGVTASFAAEGLKLVGLQSENKRTDHLERKRNESTSNENELIRKTSQPLAGIVQDITKWVAYDLILPEDLPSQVPIMEAIKYGCISGLIARGVFEVLVAKDPEKLEKPPLYRFLQAGIEGAALFASYEGSINFFETTSTPELKRILQREFADFQLHFR